MAVGRGGDVQAGDVQDDLLAVCGQDPPLALVTLLEGHRLCPGGWGVQRAVLGRAELGRSVLIFYRPYFLLLFICENIPGKFCHIPGTGTGQWSAGYLPCSASLADLHQNTIEVPGVMM